MYTEPERDALLTRLDDRSARIERALFGNGQPGLIRDVAILQEDMKEREREALALRRHTEDVKTDVLGGAKIRASWVASGTSVILVPILLAIKEVFFSDK